MNTSQVENKITKERNILIVLQRESETNTELQYLIETFCGIVVTNLSEIPVSCDEKRIYVCGNLAELKEEYNFVNIIQEFSYNYEHIPKTKRAIVTLGQVPIIISNAGVYFRNLFTDGNYFDSIKSEHEFQALTESTKQTKALRKGIYLSKISKDEADVLHFHLLRCSSNLSGPTDNFRSTDYKIINLLNDAVKYIFEFPVELNHALVQIYENRKKTEGTEKEMKSKIKAHSDKTKDMPKEGLIAFCTFYDNSNIENLKPSSTDRYDLCYKQTSALTKLHFKLKSSVLDESLEKEFSVTLYPNSVFLIPLSTNRLYTHEIRPSVLSIDKIPIRMGYVLRCSSLEALHTNEQTYIKENGKWVKLEKMSSELEEELRNSYYKENVSEDFVEYGKVHFSMNLGDYEKPIY